MWVVWLCNVHHFKDDSGKPVETKDRIKLVITLDSFEKAMNYEIVGMGHNQIKDIEKIILNKERYCNKCKYQQKIFNDRLKARQKKEQKQRAKDSGDKSGNISVIPNKDIKHWIKFMVDNKQREEEKKQAEEAKQLAEVERRKRYEQAMERRRKVFMQDQPITTPKEEPKNDNQNGTDAKS